MSREQFVKSRAGDFSLDDTPRSGRTVEVDSNARETLTESNRCYTTQGRADTLRMPKSTQLLVKIKNVSFILWKKLNRLYGQSSNLLALYLGVLQMFVSETIGL